MPVTVRAALLAAGKPKAARGRPGKVRQWRVQASDRLDGCHDAIAPDGSVFGTYPTLQKAAQICGIKQSEELRRARMVVRPCLCCGTPFDSEGAHNRMCNLCRKRGSDPVEPQRPYITRSP